MLALQPLPRATVDHKSIKPVLLSMILKPQKEQNKEVTATKKKQWDSKPVAKPPIKGKITTQKTNYGSVERVDRVERGERIDKTEKK